MDVKKQFGLKIKRLRKKRELTQEQLAEKMQIATRTLCGIENGENFVTSETLEKFFRVLGVTASEMFAFDHIKPKKELLDEIITDLKNIKSREKIEIAYKFIKSLVVE